MAYIVMDEVFLCMWSIHAFCIILYMYLDFTFNSGMLSWISDHPMSCYDVQCLPSVVALDFNIVFMDLFVFYLFKVTFISIHIQESGYWSDDIHTF